MASGNILPCCTHCKKAFEYRDPEVYLLPCLHSVCNDCLNRDSLAISCSHCKESFMKSDHIFLKDTITQKEFFTCCAKYSSEERLNDLTWNGCGVKRSNCPEHETCVLDLYDFTCEIIICSKCASAEHKQCKTKEVDGASVGRYQTILQKEQKRLEEKLQTVMAALEESKIKQTDVDEKIGDTKIAVASCFNSLRTLLTKRENELLKVLEDRHTSACNRIQEATKRLNRTAEKIQIVHDYTGKLIERGQIDDFLMLKNNIKKRLEVCLSEKVANVEADDVVVTLSDATLTEVKKCISSIGDVDSVSSSDDWTLYENVSWDIDPSQNGDSSTMKQSSPRNRFAQTPECPEMQFDIEKISTNKAHINSKGILINSKLSTERILSHYVGTTSVTPLSLNGLSYWEVETDIGIDEQMQRFGLLMEIGVVEGDDVDKQYCVSSQPSSRCLSIVHCASHKGICAKVWNRETKVRCIEDIMFNKAGESAILKHGIVFDGGKNTLTFLDLTNMKVIDVLGGEGDGCSAVWPIFGVYNSTLACVKMRLVSGSYVQLTDDKLSLLAS